MDPDLIADIVLAAIAVVGALTAFFVLREPLRDLMTQTVGIDAATKFYARVLILGLVYIAMAVVFGSGSMAKNPTFMSYVWHIGGELDDLLGWLIGFVALYTVLVTILLAAYRRRDQ
jgi:hypothetical protein